VTLCVCVCLVCMCVCVCVCVPVCVCITKVVLIQTSVMNRGKNKGNYQSSTTVKICSSTWHRAYSVRPSSFRIFSAPLQIFYQYLYWFPGGHNFSGSPRHFSFGKKSSSGAAVLNLVLQAVQPQWAQRAGHLHFGRPGFAAGKTLDRTICCASMVHNRKQGRPR
jgi:hypothetical protein